MYFVMKWRCLCDKMSGFLLWPRNVWPVLVQQKCLMGWPNKNVAWAAAKSMGWVVFNKQIGQILKNG